MAKTILGRVMPVDKGAYSSSTTYSKMDMVHSSDSTYVSKVNNNKGHAVTDTNYWACYADGKQATAAAAAATVQMEADHAMYVSDHQQAEQDHSQYQARQHCIEG